MPFFGRHTRYAPVVAGTALLISVAACSSSGGSSSTAPPAAPAATSSSSSGASSSSSAGTGNVSEINALISAEQAAPGSVVSANSVAAKIKARGVLKVGGVETAPLFSLKDPLTGQDTGFDAGLDQLLAKYIIGKPDTQITTVTSDTREALLEDHSVDAVFATYTITAAREKEVSFAGPYFGGALGIAVRKGSSGITSPSSLDGKKVVTESGSTIPAAVKSVAPKAQVQLFNTDQDCVLALQQGRADAYVLDQGVLAGDAATNSSITVLSSTFDPQPYGIGVPKDEPSFTAFINTWLKKIEADGTWAKLWKATIGTVVPGNAPTPPKVG